MIKEDFKAPDVIISLEEYDYLNDTIKELTLRVEELESKQTQLTTTYEPREVYNMANGISTISIEEYNHLKSIEDTYLQDLEFIKNKLSKK